MKLIGAISSILNINSLLLRSLSFCFIFNSSALIIISYILSRKLGIIVNVSSLKLTPSIGSFTIDNCNWLEYT